MITKTTWRWTYEPDGATTAFPFDNLVLNAGDLVVTWYDSDGNGLALPGFAVTGLGNPDGGTVLFNTAPDDIAGSLIEIVRASPEVTTGGNPTDFVQDSAATRQYYRDLGFALAQEASGRLKRTLLLSPFEADGPLVLPPPPLRENMGLVFDAMGRLIVGAPLDPGTLVAGAWIIANLLPANSQNEALDRLDAANLHGNNDFGAINTFPDQMLGDNSSKAANTRYVDGSIAASVSLLRSYLAGLTLSTVGASSAMTIAPGAAADSTNAKMLVLAAALTKTTAAWAVGNNNGGLDTGVIAINTWYHFHQIRRPDTGVVDALISLSATAPTMPANYTQFRRIGAMKTTGASQWQSFLQVGDTFHIAPVLDFNPGGNVALGLRTMSVPTGVVVSPLITVNVGAADAVGSSLTFAPGSFAAGTVGISAADNSAAFTMNVQGPVLPTNLAAQINIGMANYTGGFVSTYGWIDRRGRDL